ncbi:VIT1/CCC1 transporter family protein [Marinicaulis aureus]|uniref:VIT1/CCC1 transporter family protein n=1 Tax=Hyphococcus aureus TaxID=2666033 RepID=A0ABW1L2K4_9PROT
MAEDHLDRWKSEKTAAYLSDAVADAEASPAGKKLFTSMAQAAEEQAEIIAKDFNPPAFSPSPRARLIARLVRLFGPRAMRPILAAVKVRGVSFYSGPIIRPGHAMPTDVEKIGQRHQTGGGSLRAAVFGVNDGLISNTSLVMGVSGAALAANDVVLTGVAGLLAGAFSMAAGEYVSVRSQREMYEHQIGQEREELELYPEEEAEELALIYHARGMALEDARSFALDLIKDHDVALDALTREELGLDPDNLGSPIGAALSSFLAFTCGAIIPLTPFVLGANENAVLIAAGLAGLSLFGIGAVLSLFSGKSALAGGLRMAVIGAMAGGATYFIGSLVGGAI